jgi:glycosyltransferase involved in cell wall biosynthesis
MRIVILSQYFPPEVGAPQNRLYELAVRLQERGAEVTILTAMPNYPQMVIHKEYKGRWHVKEQMNGLTVHRSWIYASTSKGIAKRLLNYYSFVISSLFTGLFRLPKHDYILVESPPLFLGKTAYLISRLRGSKMIFNVSDLWPESAEKLGIVTNKTFLSVATWLEEFLYKKSHLITGQTQGICKDIQSRFPKKDIFWLPNGVDMKYYVASEKDMTWRNSLGFSQEDVLLLYAGIIGHAQGLEVILHAAKKLETEKNVKFLILGSGPEREKLIQLKEELRLSNVTFLDAVGKKEMPTIVRSVDAAVIPLKKLDLFLGAIPSKIFENLAMRKPILLGVLGEAKELFIDGGKAGLAFEPENAEDLAQKVRQLISDPEACARFGNNGYEYVKENFTRDLIAQKFWDKLQSIHKTK